MSAFAPPVQRLITELSKLPGVGGRTAQRLAFHMLRASDEEALALAEAIREVKQRIGRILDKFLDDDDNGAAAARTDTPKPADAPSALALSAASASKN